MWAIYEDGARPKPIVEAPVLDDDLAWIKDAFWLLSSSRVYTAVGPAPIPLSEMLAYVQLFIVIDTEEFIEYIREMDNEYLNFLAERRSDGS